MMSFVDKPLSPRSPKFAGASRPDDKSVSVGESPGRQRRWESPAMIESRKIVEQVRTVGIFPKGVDAMIADYAAAGGPGAAALNAALRSSKQTFQWMTNLPGDRAATAKEVLDLLRPIETALSGDGRLDESAAEVAALDVNLQRLRQAQSRLPTNPIIEGMIDVIIHAARRQFPGLLCMPKRGHSWPDCVMWNCDRILGINVVAARPKVKAVLQGLREAAKEPKIADRPWLDSVPEREAAMSVFLEQHASEVLSWNLLLTSSDLEDCGDELQCVVENWQVPGCMEAMTLRESWQGSIDHDDPDDADDFEDAVTRAFEAIAAAIVQAPRAGEEDVKASGAKRPEMRDLRRSIDGLHATMGLLWADRSDEECDLEEAELQFLAIDAAVTALDSGSCARLLPVVEAGTERLKDLRLEALDKWLAAAIGPTRPESKGAYDRYLLSDQPVDNDVPVDQAPIHDAPVADVPVDALAMESEEDESSEPPAKKPRVGSSSAPD